MRKINKFLSLVSLGIILGFTIGVTIAVNSVIVNQYFRYKMFRMITYIFQESLDKWVILPMLPLFIAGLLGWILVRKRCAFLSKISERECIAVGGIGLALILTVFMLHLAIIVDRMINSPKGPNVILIGVDTLRTDHLGCYGYARETSPQIDKLAGDGVLFQEAISHMPATTPSFASILTSRQPISHGVLDNNYQGYSLDDQYITLGELLKNSGYNTAAFVSAWTLSPDANLTQGFNEYNHSGLRQRTAEMVNQEVFAWLDKHKNSKFFLFIHYFDPHGRYNPPYPYDRCFDFTNQPHDISKIPFYQRHGNISDPSFYIAQYDGEIKYTDYCIGLVLKKIADLGLDEQTLIILTSDHGETMNEHLWWFDHGCFVYEEQIHVPLLLWYPKMFTQKRINALVRHIDILPSILDILGINFSIGLEGCSLLPLIKGEAIQDQLVYCESARGNPLRNKKSIRGIKGKQFAIRSKEWKLIMTPTVQGLDYQLYNLSHDPQELNNLIKNNL
ncbi:MAG: sulfatase, partial [Candidatus Omnitrophota bacterium]